MKSLAICAVLVIHIGSGGGVPRVPMSLRSNLSLGFIRNWCRVVVYVGISVVRVVAKH